MSEREPEPRRAYSVAEVAEMLPVSTAWVRQQCKSGGLALVVIGGKWMVTAESLEKLLERQPVGEAS